MTLIFIIRQWVSINLYKKEENFFADLNPTCMTLNGFKLMRKTKVEKL